MSNYAVMNYLNKDYGQGSSDVRIAQNALNVFNANHGTATSTLGVRSGKWYAEVTAFNSNAMVGLTTSSSINNNWLGTQNGDISYWGETGEHYNSSSQPFGVTSATFGLGDVIGIAIDLDSSPKTIAFYKNGSAQQTLNFTTNVNNLYDAGDYIHFACGHNQGAHQWNFGQEAWRYDPPSGFLALNTDNLPEPSITPTNDENPNDHFGVLTWTGTGTGSTRTIATGESGVSGTVDFTPALIMAKNRDNGYSWLTYNKINGYGNDTEMMNDTNGLIGTSNADQYGYISSVTNGGFVTTSGTAGDASNLYFNSSGDEYVAYCWKADTAFSNSSGTNGATVTSSGYVNTEAGFSLVSYNVPGGTDATIAHGLGAAPDMCIIKKTASGGSSQWTMYHSGTGADIHTFDGTYAGGYTYFSANSNTITTSGSSSMHTGDFIMMSWTQIDGYSKFGTYGGNNSTDGTFIYTGFRPKFILVRQAAANFGYHTFDDRVTYNLNDTGLALNSSNAENTSSDRGVDFLANGFKWRSNFGSRNGDGGTYIYMAFAENPLKYAKSR